MSTLYEFAGEFPFAESEALARVASMMKSEITAQDNGTRTVTGSGLVAYTNVPEAEDLGWITELLGFRPSFSILLNPYGPTDQFASPERLMIEIVASFRAPRSVRGALFVDYGADDSLVLVIEDGKVLLNEHWDGWETGSGLLDAVDGPYELQELRFLRPDTTA